jgi:hypothetical protein
LKYHKHKYRVPGASLVGIISLFFCANGLGYTLWSIDDLQLGTGKFYGPGNDRLERPLFPLVIRNIMFISSSDAITPFVNGISETEHLCEERGRIDGRLSNGLEINENISTCATSLGGSKVVVAVVNGGQHRGRQITTLQSDGNILISADLALDFGEKKVSLLPFYATTGSVTVPSALALNGQEKHPGRAGKYAAGTVLKGRVGDFNGDGWIDGTFVAAGNMPLDSPVRPGQPFVMIRNFETNIPIDGVLSGNVKALARDGNNQH